MRLSILTLAAGVSAIPSSVLERQVGSIYPMVQILPVPGYNSAPDGFNSLASIYTSSAGQLSSQAQAIAQTGLAVNGSGGIQYNYDVKANLTAALSTVNNIFWQTAYQAELKVCSIVTSINRQNVDTARGSLTAAITAEAQAILSIVGTLLNTVAIIKAQATAFADSEKAVIAALVQAIAAAAAASAGPAAVLSAGLSATGASTLNEVVAGLQAAVASLQAAAKINWAYS
ncbi:hypothetical protein T440DRAFT_559499 [Plenodomus tracheiphilus IPT5]|uniref:Uncharacterized protein n=1 Tax=Plenodomus tracheiphilus IPT5 TaxID=1408161 RepID=A0A6A7AN47_9PLEO|nr:hypothetical protein T440DRAFT_559499 [Plenodomus tracheiphilus IPT5]